jgi:hypothetical protein
VLFRSIIAVTFLLPLSYLSAQGVHPSGFLGDYSKLKPWEEDEDLLVFEKPGVNWKQYKRLMVDEIVVDLHPSNNARKVKPRQLVKQTDYFRDQIVKALKDDYPVTSTPAPDVLRIKVALTDINPTNSGVNFVSSAVIMVPVDIGGAGIEAEFVDSVTNERLYAVMADRQGKMYNVMEGSTKFSHARGAFKHWAKELRIWLDEVNEVE